MIDMAKEQTRTFAELAKLWPSRHPGKATHKATILRYAREGIQGVRLESARVGGHFISSIEAMNRVVEALPALHENPEARAEVAAGKAPTPAGRRRSADKAAQELDALGI